MLPATAFSWEHSVAGASSWPVASSSTGSCFWLHVDHTAAAQRQLLRSLLHAVDGLSRPGQ